ncbi:MAG: type II toxin-antitoxin system HicA family toxin [Candidatus Dadabacteria bacterium]|nr:type II toxin-antitoxin system HicA family toxin [Candidatus Dadabacteria bacterium]
MKRRDLIRYLESHGCEFVREGKRHSWWFNPSSGKHAAIPRHREIGRYLAREICSQLGIQELTKHTFHEVVGEYLSD